MKHASNRVIFTGTDWLTDRVDNTGQQAVSSAYVTTLTFNGSCPSNVTSHRDIMTSLSLELNRAGVCVWSSQGSEADVCQVSNYAVCPGVSSKHRRTVRQTHRSSPPLTVSIVLYAPRKWVIFVTILRQFTIQYKHWSRRQMRSRATKLRCRHYCEWLVKSYRLKWWVLSWDLKTVQDQEVLMESGRLFHHLGPCSNPENT